MYVYDLFIDLNENKLINTLCNSPYFFYEIDIDNTKSKKEKNIIKEKIKDRYKEELKKIKNIEPYYSDDKLLIAYPSFGNNKQYELGSLDIDRKEEILKDLNIDNFKNPLFCLLGIPRNVVLGYKLSNINLKIIDVYTLAALVLKEITILGIDEESNLENLKNIEESLYNQDDNLITYSSEEVFESLGIKRTKRDDEEVKKYMLEVKKDIKILINLIKEILC